MSSPIKKLEKNAPNGLAISGPFKTNSTRPSIWYVVRNTVGDSNGCAPTALTFIVQEHHYTDIDMWLQQIGVRKPGKGTKVGKIGLEKYGFKKVTLGLGLTVSGFARIMRHGTFLVRVEGHALVVKDGIIYNTYHGSRRQFIKSLYLYDPNSVVPFNDQTKTI